MTRDDAARRLYEYERREIGIVPMAWGYLIDEVKERFRRQADFVAGLTGVAFDEPPDPRVNVVAAVLAGRFVTSERPERVAAATKILAELDAMEKGRAR